VRALNQNTHKLWVDLLPPDSKAIALRRAKQLTKASQYTLTGKPIARIPRPTGTARKPTRPLRILAQMRTLILTIFAPKTTSKTMSKHLKSELLSTIIAFGIMAIVIYIGHLYGLELEKIMY